MSSYALGESDGHVLAAWETRERVYYDRVDPADLAASRSIAVSGASQKHPVILSNAMGETLFAWTEGTGWQRGGALAWQVYDRNGAPTASRGRVDGIPVWSLATAYARPDGSFVIVY